jgi:hypothetical protein
MSGIRARDFTFLLFVVAVIGLLTVLSMTGKEKFIPRTKAHMDVARIEDTAQADAVCRSCHDGAKPASPEVMEGPPMPENHPLRKKNCRQCHRLVRRK